MNYHTPITQNVMPEVLPPFMEKNGELVLPQKVYSKAQYPKLPSDMVKIKGCDGTNILIPRSKLNPVSN